MVSQELVIEKMLRHEKFAFLRGQHFNCKEMDDSIVEIFIAAVFPIYLSLYIDNTRRDF